MTDVAIRPATIDDVATIRDLATASWHAAYDDLIGADTVETVVARWYDRQVLEKHVTDPTSPFLLAFRSGTPVGYANAGPDSDREDVFELWRLYVHPDYWGEGVGTRLLATIEERLGDGDGSDGRETLELTVLANNDRGRRFYEARGFELVDRKPTSLADTSVVECVYRKSLARRQG